MKYPRPSPVHGEPPRGNCTGELDDRHPRARGPVHDQPGRPDGQARDRGASVDAELVRSRRSRGRHGVEQRARRSHRQGPGRDRRPAGHDPRRHPGRRPAGAQAARSHSPTGWSPRRAIPERTRGTRTSPTAPDLVHGDSSVCVARSGGLARPTPTGGFRQLAWSRSRSRDVRSPHVGLLRGTPPGLGGWRGGLNERRAPCSPRST